MEEGSFYNDWDVVSAVASVQSYTSAIMTPPSQTETANKSSLIGPPSPSRSTTKRTKQKSTLYKNESDNDDMLHFIHDGAKNGRGGKTKFMFKGNQRLPKGCLQSCRSCKRELKRWNEPMIRRKKENLRRFCSEITKY